VAGLFYNALLTQQPSYDDDAFLELLLQLPSCDDALELLS
jgi:hypothetical protein